MAGSLDNMSMFILRIGVLVLVSILLWLIVWSGRRFVETQRTGALAAAPINNVDAYDSLSLVRILAFSSSGS